MQTPYFWLMIADLAASVIMDIMADSGVSAEDVTREDWLNVSGDLKTRRKAAADRIRQHSQEVK